MGQENELGAIPLLTSCRDLSLYATKQRIGEDDELGRREVEGGEGRGGPARERTG